MKRNRCDYCGKVLKDDEQGYGLNIEMFALAEPLDITEEDLKKDYKQELESLIEKMENVDVSEAEDQVHEVYQFVLCWKCRNYLHKRLKFRHSVN